MWTLSVSLVALLVVQSEGAYKLPNMFEVLEAQSDPSLVSDASFRAALAKTGLPWKVRHRQTGAVLLLVPPGQFVRGSSRLSEDEYAGVLVPWRRTVLIEEPFYLAQTELTRGQWSRAMDPLGSLSQAESEFPMADVEMAEIQEFLAATNLELPRDSEWEYASKAGSDLDRYGPLDEICWHRENAGWVQGEAPPRYPVAMKRPNAWGFHDTLGNVWEVTGSFVPPVEWAGIPAGELYLARHDDIPRSRGYSLRGGGLGSPIYAVSSVFYQQCRHDQQNIGIGFRIAWHFPGNKVPVVGDEVAAEEEWLGSL